MTALRHILPYVRDVEMAKLTDRETFGFRAVHHAGDRIRELATLNGGAHVLVHTAATSAPQLQAQAKRIASVADAPAFCAMHPIFGPFHEADGHALANARDPASNSVQVNARPLADP